jgi:hypothetical protein
MLEGGRQRFDVTPTTGQGQLGFGAIGSAHGHANCLGGRFNGHDVHDRP